MSNDSDSKTMSTTKKATRNVNKKNGELTIRVLMFSGKKKDWVHWEEKFLAKAKCKGLKDLYLGRL